MGQTFENFNALDFSHRHWVMDEVMVVFVKIFARTGKVRIILFTTLETGNEEMKIGVFIISIIIFSAEY